MPSTGDLLYDSEAALRLVDNVLREFAPAAHSEAAAAAATVQLATVVEHGQRELLTVLDSLRQSRGLLERATAERLAQADQRAHDAANTATGITDGLQAISDIERRLAAIVSVFDAAAAPGPPSRLSPSIDAPPSLA